MEKMHYNISVRLFTAGKCFGPGMAALLSLVRERHSLRAAAAEMGMAYSKAWRILRDCEGALGFPLLDSTTGGRHGGGAVLTAEAEALLSDMRPSAGGSARRAIRSFPSALSAG